MIPGLAALVALPFIVHYLGIAGYGLLTVIAAIVGYFALIDIAITTGAVKFVAEFRARGEARSESEVVVLGLFVALSVGVIGCAGLLVFAEPIMTRLFRIPEEHLAPGIAALEIAAFGFFLAQLQQYLQSLPQALQRFPLSAAVESAFGVLVPVASVAVLVLGQGLEEVVLARVACSALNIAVLAWLCRSLFPAFEWRLPGRALVGEVLSFSAFAYLSRLAALTHAHADKLIIGAFLGMGAVAYFTVASTLANRVLSITFRLSSIMYPAAAALAATAQWERLKDAYFNTARYVFCINAAAVLLMMLFAREIMHYWMGPEFAAYGEVVMILTALAMLVDSLTNLPSLVNDGLGHTRVTGMWAFARAGVGVLLLFALVGPFGIEGAAAAHLAAGALMTALFLAHVHGRTVPFSLSELLSHAYLRAGLVALGIAAPGVLLRPQQTLGLFDATALAAIVMLVYAAASLLFVVQREHLAKVLSRSG